MSYELWQWLFFGIAAMIIGMSKCGIPGLGILNVVIFQNILLAKDATGFGLPLLIVGDVCAMIAYRRPHAKKILVGIVLVMLVCIMVTKRGPSRATKHNRSKPK